MSWPKPSLAPSGQGDVKDHQYFQIIVHIYVKHIHVNFNKTIKYNIPSPTTGVGLSKPRDNTMASPLRPKSVVVETLATPPTTEAHHNINQAHMRPFHRGLVAT